ncbi:MAG TPA: hypothetical protein VK763_14390 [Terriglobales bacterium]|jgi:hypothetical protein|nr:hypothetical protein [Terriglobales bacterium]
MRRIRTVKPEFFLHEDLYDLEKRTGLPIRLSFVGLWTCADREGRFRWRPRTLKAMILPFDDVDFGRVLDALATRGFIVKYEVSAEFYGCIPSWKRHQVINNRESASEIPAPGEHLTGQQLDACPTRAPRVDDATSTALEYAQAEGKGTEGKGTEGKGVGIARDTFLSDDKAAPQDQPFDGEVPPTPDGLHSLNYAAKVIEVLGIVDSKQNKIIIAAAVDALAKSGMSKPAAAEFLVARALDDRDEGIPIDKFWFEDSKWNRGSRGNGKLTPEQITSREIAIGRKRRADREVNGQSRAVL